MALSVKCSESQQATIFGRIQLDSSWNKRVFISRIPDFNQMFKVSDKLIIGQANIDSAGNYVVRFPSSNVEALYRLHVVRATDPAATLIIGSEDENHVFFIAGGSSLIRFDGPAKGKLMNQSAVKGGNTNAALDTLLLALNNGFVNRDSLKNQLISTARQSHSEIVGLLAIYSCFGLSAKQKEEIADILGRYHKENPYGTRIFEEYRTDHNLILLLVLILMILFFLLFGYRIYRKRVMAKISQTLSQRESGIARLILEGRSNKEIATELNIELSTVKTHVNNIYSKLKVTSRKELLKYQAAFSNPSQK